MRQPDQIIQISWLVNNQMQPCWADLLLGEIFQVGPNGDEYPIQQFDPNHPPPQVVNALNQLRRQQPTYQGGYQPPQNAQPQGGSYHRYQPSTPQYAQGGGWQHPGYQAVPQQPMQPQQSSTQRNMTALHAVKGRKAQSTLSHVPQQPEPQHSTDRGAPMDPLARRMAITKHRSTEPQNKPQQYPEKKETKVLKSGDDSYTMFGKVTDVYKTSDGDLHAIDPKRLLATPAKPNLFDGNLCISDDYLVGHGVRDNLFTQYLITSGGRMSQNQGEVTMEDKSVIFPEYSENEQRLKTDMDETELDVIGCVRVTHGFDMAAAEAFAESKKRETNTLSIAVYSGFLFDTLDEDHIDLFTNKLCEKPVDLSIWIEYALAAYEIAGTKYPQIARYMEDVMTGWHNTVLRSRLADSERVKNITIDNFFQDWYEFCSYMDDNGLEDVRVNTETLLMEDIPSVMKIIVQEFERSTQDEDADASPVQTTLTDNIDVVVSAPNFTARYGAGRLYERLEKDLSDLCVLAFDQLAVRDDSIRQAMKTELADEEALPNYLSKRFCQIKVLTATQTLTVVRNEPLNGDVTKLTVTHAVDR